jgi:hypothetical protein
MNMVTNPCQGIPSNIVERLALALRFALGAPLPAAPRATHVDNLAIISTQE